VSLMYPSDLALFGNNFELEGYCKIKEAAEAAVKEVESNVETGKKAKVSVKA